MIFKNVYEMVNYYYSTYDGLGNRYWSIDRVWNVVGKPNSINQEQYQQITGFVYPAKA